MDGIDDALADPGLLRQLRMSVPLELRAPDEAGRRRAYAGLVKDLNKLAVKAATP